MSFNQKTIAVITVLVAGATSAITFVCFEPPYRENFWIAYGCLTFSEIVFGAFWIQQIGKADSAFPLSMGVWALNAAYFLFSLIVTFLTGLEGRKFVLVEVIGFVLFVVAHLFFRIAEHHVEELAKDDIPEEIIERAKVTWR